VRGGLLLLAVSAALCVPAATAAVPRAFFLSTCAFSHRAPDDPIVYPRAPGFSHDHTFVGNVSTNAFSTVSSLRKAGTTCSAPGDTAAYWAPTLYADGRPVTPTTAQIYYRRGTSGRIRPFPFGLRMVAGNSHAIRPQSTAVTYWDCSVLKTTFYGVRNALPPPAVGVAASSDVPACPIKAELQLHVNFPDCWDGKHLDSADHRSHMAYAVNGRCPAGHPVAVPAISLVYSYPARATDGASVVILSSGGQHSGHADFVNSWHEDDLTKLVDRCLNAYEYCAAEVNLG
jgi:hypothetical protein